MSAPDPLAFSLIDQPWLMARTARGSTEELSLTEVFERAQTLTSLVGDVPTQVFASTRLLLAILHSAIDGPRDTGHWLDLWEAQQLPTDKITSYLRKHRSRFDLLHPTTPFFQVSGLRTLKGEMSGLDRLIADVPNGQPFFSTRLGGQLTLNFAEAARWIVHAQAFDPSGIKSGAEGDPRVKGGKGYPIGTGWSGFLGGVLAEGNTLKDTLLLNLIARDYGATARNPSVDRPVWERDPVGPGEEEPGGREPTGPVDLYTWQSRRVRLAHDGARVRHVLICNGERITPQNKHTVEPQTGWRRSRAQEKKLGAPLVYMPREHDAERAVWRGLQSLLPGAVISQSSEAAPFLVPSVLNWIGSVSEAIGLGYPIRLHALGMTYGSQSATTEEIVDDILQVRAVLLREDTVDLVGIVLACAAAAEAVAYAVGKLAGDIAVAAGCGRYEREGTVTGSRASILAALDTRFRAWLWTLGPDTSATTAQLRWYVTMEKVARTLGNGLIARASEIGWLNSALADRDFRRKVHELLPSGHSVFGSLAATEESLLPETAEKDRWVELQSVGVVVHDRIQNLQEGIRTNRSAAVDTLARLRRGLGKPAGSVNDIVQYTMVDEFVGHDAKDEPTVAENAAHIALTLYALHQQFQGQRMHQRAWGLGRAVRRLHPDELGIRPDPVLRRFEALGTSSSLDELVHHAQGLVQLLRAKQIPLDYGLLADQIVAWQRPGGASAVRLRWGREFFRTPSLNDDSL